MLDTKRREFIALVGGVRYLDLEQSLF